MVSIWVFPPEAATICSASASLPGSGAATAVTSARAAPLASVSAAATMAKVLHGVIAVPQSLRQSMSQTGRAHNRQSPRPAELAKTNAHMYAQNPMNGRSSCTGAVCENGMTASVIVALIAGVFALIAAVISAVNTRAIERMKAAYDAQDKEREESKNISVYSEPFARSAFDLQSRLYNIVANNLAAIYISRGNPRESSYVIENTTFLIAQFFCWSEMTRQEINYIRLADSAQTRALLRRQDEIYSVWGSDGMPPTFRIFAGEQRAVGEALIQGEHEFTTCMGYGDILTSVSSGPEPID